VTTTGRVLVSSHLELVDDLLREISFKLKEKIEPARQRAERLGSICGLASLSPGLLALIFSFAIHGFTNNNPRSFTIVHLSHVCRHFRNTAMANPHLWSEIRATPYKPEMGFVDACLQRSKDSPLDISLNLYASCQWSPADALPWRRKYLSCDRVFSAMTPHISRWRCLHLNFVDAKGFVGSSSVFERIQGSSFPILESITEFHNGSNTT